MYETIKNILAIIGLVSISILVFNHQQWINVSKRGSVSVVKISSQVWSGSCIVPRNNILDAKCYKTVLRINFGE